MFNLCADRSVSAARRSWRDSPPRLTTHPCLCCGVYACGMRHAASLLAANAGSIEQIALHAGYQSRSSFTRTFRKHYGTDPSDYRSEAKRVSDIYDVAEDATAAE
ncbi:helix-turn-helix domain-containing protein [Rhizobium ruizarguesonis]